MGRLLIFLAGAALASPVTAQPASNEMMTEPRPLSEADDPLNQFVERSTVDGLVVQILIDGGNVALDNAVPARIPRRADRRNLRGDTVTLSASSGAAAVGSTTVSDELLNVQEGVGLVRRPQRSIIVAVPTAAAADSIEVRVSASGTVRRFDVRSAYAEICRALPDAPFCRGRPPYPAQ